MYKRISSMTIYESLVEEYEGIPFSVEIERYEKE